MRQIKIIRGHPEMIFTHRATKRINLPHLLCYLLFSPVVNLLFNPGFPQCYISYDEVKAVESSGAPVFQSGYIAHYSGVGNFNKNSKNGSKISS